MNSEPDKTLHECLNDLANAINDLLAKVFCPILDTITKFLIWLIRP